MKEKKENKILDIIFTIIKLICVVILILLILALGIQRFSSNEKAIGGIRIFNVATGSMIPKYEVGDILVVKEVDTNELEVGDDITYLGKVSTFAGRVVTHQIIKIEESESGEKTFQTKGIANDTADPEITADQIYGKVIYKCVILSLLTKLMNNMVAFYIVVFIPLGILIFLQIKDRIDEKREELEDNEDDEENSNK